MGDFYKLLFDIRNRYRLYFDTKSLRKLRIFLDGYNCAMHMNGFIEDEFAEFYNEFQKYIQDKYHVDIMQHWAEILCFYCGDEERAFDEFYRLLPDFFEEYSINNSSPQ